MEFRANRRALMKGLGQVIGVIERRQTLPMLSNLLCEAGDGILTLTGTDLEVEITAQVPIDSIEEGTCTVPGRKFFDICRALPDDANVKLRATEEKALLSSGRGRYVLMTMNASAYPRMTMDSQQWTLRPTIDVWRRLLDKTAFAMAHQDVRYYLNGILLVFGEKQLSAVATDGHRLAKVDVDHNELTGEATQIILPAKTVQELKRIIANEDADQIVSTSVSERMACIEFAETRLISKLVDGRYPDYERVIPVGLREEARIEVDALRSGLLRAAVLSNEKYKGVRFEFKKERLRLVANNPEQEEAEEEIEIDYDGPEIVIGFNVGYVLDVLSAVSEATVRIGFSDGNSSSVWQGVGGEREIFVIMPMRL
ncbi:DNA polymerase III subunit beta [Thioalkalicoccus limnaeus]|uniref:Beta sliding clamp n=1 Tax=Thioalkalicoccus limnaeus TaxID=120681 RepID=A0ABV4BHD0_9GAMM